MARLSTSQNLLHLKPACQRNGNILHGNQKNDIQLSGIKMISENNTLELISWLCSTFLNRSSYTTETTEEITIDGESLQPVSKSENVNSDKGAFMYIITVLIFYSAAIVLMVIKYLNAGSAEKNEEAMLEAFFQNMPTGRTEKENQVNQVAIRAFHTLTTAAHDDDDYDDDSLSSSPELLITDV